MNTNILLGQFLGAGQIDELFSRNLQYYWCFLDCEIDGNPSWQDKIEFVDNVDSTILSEDE